jgi:hypothetical protein
MNRAEVAGDQAKDKDRNLLENTKIYRKTYRRLSRAEVALLFAENAWAGVGLAWPVSRSGGIM